MHQDGGASILPRLLQHRHETDGNRRGDKRIKTKAKPKTVHTYHGHLRAFFYWLVEEGIIEDSPMAAIKPPICRADQIQPFTPDQINALLKAAERSKQPQRNKAILLFLLDTGVRASELVGLKMNDLNLSG